MIRTTLLTFATLAALGLAATAQDGPTPTASTYPVIGPDTYAPTGQYPHAYWNAYPSDPANLSTSPTAAPNPYETPSADPPTPYPSIPAYPAMPPAGLVPNPAIYPTANPNLQAAQATGHATPTLPTQAQPASVAPPIANQVEAPPALETTVPAEPVVPAETIEEPLVIEPRPTAWYYQPVYWVDLWEGAFELGLSGSDGNSQTLNYLVGLDAKRETKKTITDLDLRYDRKSSNSVETAHRLFADARWERLFGDSPWSWYVRHTTEYDEFTAFDVRITFNSGIGRSWIKTDNTTFLTRLGAGASQEIGGPDEDWVPEGVFGLEFERKLTEKQKLSLSSEFLPDVTEVSDYRINTKANWDMLIDEQTNMSLRVGVLDRYDSTPNGAKANDLDYTITLLWNF